MEYSLRMHVSAIDTAGGGGIVLGPLVKSFRDFGNEIFVLLKDGTYIRLSEDETHAFREGKDSKKIKTVKNKRLCEKLAKTGILCFKDYQTEQDYSKIPYDLRLHKFSGESPIYPAPVIVHLAIEWKCNLNCVYCSVKGKYSPAKEKLFPEQFKAIIDKLDDWGVAHVSFTGGEPVLDVNLLTELLEYSSNKSFSVNFSSNGVLINESVAKKLSETGVENVLVSMDSHIPEIHNMLRGKGTWKKVFGALKTLKEYGFKIGIDCVVSKLNVGHIIDFARFLDNQEIPYLTLIKLKQGPMSEELYKSLLPSAEEYSKMLKTVGIVQKDLSTAITLDCGSISHLVNTFSMDDIKKVPVLGCPVGFTQIVINPDGKIFPCAALMDRQFYIGNALNDDLKRMWIENEKLKSLRSISGKIKACTHCEYLKICRGGCRGISWSIEKDIYAKDPTCPRFSKEVQSM